MSSSPYEEALLDFRRRKDEHFAAGNGPVDAATFHGLRYYPPDPAWTFSAPLTLTLPGPAAEFTLDTNTGEPRTMALYGTVTLPLPGGEQTVSVFAPLGEETPQRVFIPFRDATSGQETYGAGRYLDAPLARSDDGDALVSVDFNLAYHPYCAYGDGWTCPLPPRENVLPVAVPAGERLPEA
ncbi:hypothetical protein GCM10010840_09070 [Deinococcus aerolatus]|uniref:DUF1684 domain-containing protein n=1 Tax=Deinococcus aerolatus TaxID=522487 RepID=A0ABQ2G368_9DEIO|nr:DUF1684 domain-containing protein [Deinococcus aerolatus]GGL73235.1 hypothetical protein GCM10010840_09070 [Deinococcus aerolatus]